MLFTGQPLQGLPKWQVDAQQFMVNHSMVFFLAYVFLPGFAWWLPRFYSSSGPKEGNGLMQSRTTSQQQQEKLRPITRSNQVVYSPLPLSPTNHCSLFLNNTLKVVREP